MARSTLFCGALGPGDGGDCRRTRGPREGGIEIRTHYARTDPGSSTRNHRPHALRIFAREDSRRIPAYPISAGLEWTALRRRRIVVFQSVWSALNRDRKSTRLNSSHVSISYAVFCLKKK